MASGVSSASDPGSTTAFVTRARSSVNTTLSASPPAPSTGSCWSCTHPGRWSPKCTWPKSYARVPSGDRSVVTVVDSAPLPPPRTSPVTRTAPTAAAPPGTAAGSSNQGPSASSQVRRWPSAGSCIAYAAYCTRACSRPLLHAGDRPDTAVSRCVRRSKVSQRTVSTKGRSPGFDTATSLRSSVPPVAQGSPSFADPAVVVRPSSPSRQRRFPAEPEASSTRFRRASLSSRGSAPPGKFGVPADEVVCSGVNVLTDSTEVGASGVGIQKLIQPLTT